TATPHTQHLPLSLHDALPICLGIAILSKPKFLILDEPTSGLDPTGIIHLRNTLQNLIKEEDISILFSSHQLGEVEKLADRIICIDRKSTRLNSSHVWI